VFRQVKKGGRLGGPLSGSAVHEVVIAYARRIGLDAGGYSAHSLRTGFLTSAAEAGASVFKMQAVSRHKSMDVLSGYIRSADAFRDHAGAARSCDRPAPPVADLRREAGGGRRDEPDSVDIAATGTGCARPAPARRTSTTKCCWGCRGSGRIRAASSFGARGRPRVSAPGTAWNI
jgi:hypothetical protein